MYRPDNARPGREARALVLLLLLVGPALATLAPNADAHTTATANEEAILDQRTVGGNVAKTGGGESSGIELTPGTRYVILVGTNCTGSCTQSHSIAGVSTAGAGGPYSRDHHSNSGDSWSPSANGWVVHYLGDDDAGTGHLGKWEFSGGTSTAWYRFETDYAGSSATQYFRALTRNGAVGDTGRSATHNGNTVALSYNADASFDSAPSAPQAFRVWNETSALNLSWTAPATGSPTAYTYTVSRYREGSGTAEATFTATATSWRDTNVSRSVVYNYTVTAANTAGTGPATSRANGSAALANLTATASGTTVNVSWTALNAAPMWGFTGYNVYRDGSRVATNVQAAYYVDSGLSELTSYTYNVTWNAPAGEGPNATTNEDVAWGVLDLGTVTLAGNRSVVVPDVFDLTLTRDGETRLVYVVLARYDEDTDTAEYVHADEWPSSASSYRLVWRSTETSADDADAYHVFVATPGGVYVAGSDLTLSDTWTNRTSDDYDFPDLTSTDRSILGSEGANAAAEAWLGNNAPSAEQAVDAAADGIGIMLALLFLGALGVIAIAIARRVG